MNAFLQTTLLYSGLVFGATQPGKSLDNYLNEVDKALKDKNTLEAELLMQRARQEHSSADAQSVLVLRLGVVHHRNQMFREAEKLYEESLSKHRSLQDDVGFRTRGFTGEFTTRSNLGALYRQMEEYPKAIAAYTSCEQVLEKAKKSGVTVNALDQAYFRNNRGKLFELLGQYRAAQAEYDLCLSVLAESSKAEEMVLKCECWNNRGWLSYLVAAEQAADRADRYRAGGEDSSLALETAKKHLEKQLSAPVANRWNRVLAESCSNLAILALAQKRHEEADRYFREGLELSRRLAGPTHPLTRKLEYHQAALNRALGKRDAAAEVYKTTLKNYGSRTDPTVAVSHAQLAWVLACQDEWESASEAMDNCRHLLRRHAHTVLSMQSEREQLPFLKSKDRPWFHAALTLGLRGGANRQVAERSAEWALNGKGMTIQVLAERTVLKRQARSSDRGRELLERLEKVRGELQARTLRTPDNKLAQLVREEEELSHQLATELGTRAAQAAWVTLADVRKALPPHSVLLEIVRFEPANFAESSGSDLEFAAPRYVAWVIAPAGDPRGVRVFDLQEAGRIETAIAQVHHQLEPVKEKTGFRPRGQEKETNEALQALTNLLLPEKLYEHIKGDERWIIGADAELWRVPWAALLLPEKDTPFAVEKKVISSVTSGRDLLPVARAGIEPTAPLIFAMPNYGKAPEGASDLFKAMRVDDSKEFMKGLQDWLKTKDNSTPRVLRGNEATEAAFHRTSNPRALVFSTHGFSELKKKSSAHPDNPLYFCGLALASANANQLQGGGTDGILSGWEILDADLRGTELVFLGACSTAVGQVQPGEGVGNLQFAFRLAGAQAVVATLWEVPDLPTGILSVKFFDKLKEADYPRALQAAQIAWIDELRADGYAHPFTWAGLTLTGKAK